MDCKTATGYLPWLLNGSLEPAEKAAVEGHLATCEGCGRELARTREALEIFGHHLAPQALVDYAFGLQSTDLDGERIERHLASCAACAAELELVRESRVASEAPETLLAAPAGAEDRFRRPRGAAPSRRPVYLRAFALAASLVAVVAAGGWFWSFQQLGFGDGRAAQLEDELRRLRSETPESGEEAVAFQARISALEQERRALAARTEDLESDLVAEGRRIEELESRLAAGAGPALNVAVVDLFPGETVLRGGGTVDTPVAAVPADAGLTTLILNSSLESGQALGVRLLGPDGRELWRRDGLRRDADGYFNLALPLAGLASGLHTLELRDPAAGEDAAALEIYRLRVE